MSLCSPGAISTAIDDASRVPAAAIHRVGTVGTQLTQQGAAAAEMARDDALKGTGFRLKDIENAAELTGTGMRLDLVATFDNAMAPAGCTRSRP